MCVFLKKKKDIDVAFSEDLHAAFIAHVGKGKYKTRGLYVLCILGIKFTMHCESFDF